MEMITRTEAERIAVSIHAIRSDWPVSSLTTYITEHLASWPLLDAYVGLAYVAIERNASGWVSEKPARVEQNGPWRQVGTFNHEAEALKVQAEAERQSRLVGIKERNRRIAACGLCDDRGYINGYVCQHVEPNDEHRSQLVAAARAAIRPTKGTRTEEEA